MGDLMRTWLFTLVLVAAAGLSGCSSTVDQTERRRDNAGDSASQKAGRAAHDLARESDEAARKAGAEIKKAAKGLREGWKEAEHDEPIKAKKP